MRGSCPVNVTDFSIKDATDTLFEEEYFDPSKLCEQKDAIINQMPNGFEC